MSASFLDLEHLQQLNYERSKLWSSFLDEVSQKENHIEVDISELEDVIGPEHEENDNDDDLASMEDEDSDELSIDSDVLRNVTNTTRLNILFNNNTVALPETATNNKNLQIVDLFNQTLPIISEHNRQLKEYGFDRILNTFDKQKIEDKVGSWLNRHNTLYGGDATLLCNETRDNRIKMDYETNFQSARNKRNEKEDVQDDTNDTDDSLHSGETARYIRSSRATKNSSTSTTTMIKTYRMVKSKREALKEKYACEQDDDETHLKAIRHRRKIAASEIEYHHKHYDYSYQQQQQRSHKKHNQMYVTPTTSNHSQKRKVLRKRTPTNSCSTMDASSGSDDDFFCDKNHYSHRKMLPCCSMHHCTPAHSKYASSLPYSTGCQSYRSAMKMPSGRTNRIYFYSHSKSLSSSSSSTSITATCERKRISKRNNKFYNDKRPCRRESDCRCCNERKLCQDYKHVADTSTEEWFVENCYSPKKTIKSSCTKTNLCKPVATDPELVNSLTDKEKRNKKQITTQQNENEHLNSLIETKDEDKPLKYIKQITTKHDKNEHSNSLTKIEQVDRPKRNTKKFLKEIPTKQNAVENVEQKKINKKATKTKKNKQVIPPIADDTFNTDLQLAIELSKKLYEEEQKMLKRNKTKDQSENKEKYEVRSTKPIRKLPRKQDEEKNKEELKTIKPLKKLPKIKVKEESTISDMEQTSKENMTMELMKTNRKRQTTTSDLTITNDEEIKEKIPKLIDPKTLDDDGIFAKPYPKSLLKKSSKTLEKSHNSFQNNSAEETFFAPSQIKEIYNSTAKSNDTQAFKRQFTNSLTQQDEIQKHNNFNEVKKHNTTKYSNQIKDFETTKQKSITKKKKSSSSVTSTAIETFTAPVETQAICYHTAEHNDADRSLADSLCQQGKSHDQEKLQVNEKNKRDNTKSSKDVKTRKTSAEEIKKFKTKNITSTVTSTTIRSPDDSSSKTKSLIVRGIIDLDSDTDENSDCTQVTSTTNIESNVPPKAAQTLEEQQPETSTELSSTLTPSSNQQQQHSPSTSQQQNQTLNTNLYPKTQKGILIYAPQIRSLVPANSFSNDGYFIIAKEHLSSIIGENLAEKFCKYYIGRRRFNSNSTIYFRPPSAGVLDTNDSSESDDDLESVGQYGDLYESFNKTTEGGNK